MRLIYTFLLVFAFANQVSSQSFEWIQGRDINYEMNPDMLNYSVAASVDGTIWHGGMKNFVEFYNDAMGDLFLAQFDSDGNLLHDYQITGSAKLKNMVTDSQGNLYVTGQTLTALDFWDGSHLSINGDFIEGFLIKVSPSGTVEWTINLSDLFTNAVPEDLFISNGSIFLAHSEWPESNITEFDGGGNALRTINQHNVSLVSGVVLDAESNIYATGSCPNLQSAFGGVIFESPFPYSLYLVKYSPLGVPEWVKFTEDITCIKPKIAIDGAGRIIWAGPLNTETYFDTIAMMGPAWIYDLFVTAFNSEGHSLWGVEVPQVLTGDATTAKSKPMVILSDNSVTVAGFTRGTIDWGNGVVSGSTGTAYRSLVLNISSTGVANWVKTAGGVGYNQVFAMDKDTDDNLYLTGSARETVQFDTCSYTGDSYYYPFLTKLNTGVTTGISKPDSRLNFTVYPNPTGDYLVVGTSAKDHFTLILSNIDGQEILKQTTVSPSTKIDVSKLPSGVYLLKLVNPQGFFEVRKVIIN